MSRKIKKTLTPEELHKMAEEVAFARADRLKLPPVDPANPPSAWEDAVAYKSGIVGHVNSLGSLVIADLALKALNDYNMAEALRGQIGAEGGVEFFQRRARSTLAAILGFSDDPDKG